MWKVTAVEGRFVKDGITAASFSATDWRKTGTLLNLEIEPVLSNMNAVVEAVGSVAKSVERQSGWAIIRANYESGFLETVGTILRLTAPCWDCQIAQHLVVDSVGQKFSPEGSEYFLLPRAAQEQIITAAQEPER